MDQRVEKPFWWSCAEILPELFSAESEGDSDGRPRRRLPFLMICLAVIGDARAPFPEEENDACMENWQSHIECLQDEHATPEKETKTSELGR